MPEMITCPIITGVSTTFMRPAARRRASAREPRLAVGEVAGPHDDPLALLPLEQHRLVADLGAVLVDLVVPEHRACLQRQQGLADLVGVEAADLLHALGVDHAPGVAGGGVIAGLVLEL